MEKIYQIIFCLIEIENIQHAQLPDEEYIERGYICIQRLSILIADDDFDELFTRLLLLFLNPQKLPLTTATVYVYIQEYLKTNEENEVIINALTTPESPFSLNRDSSYEYFKVVDLELLQALIVNQKIFEYVSELEQEGCYTQARELDNKITYILKNTIKPKSLFKLYTALTSQRNSLVDAKLSRTLKRYTIKS